MCPGLASRKSGNFVKLEFPRTGESSFKQKSELLIADFVIQTMSPLSIVEKPAFVRLVKGEPHVDDD